MWDALGWSEELANGGMMTVHENYQAALNPLVGHIVNLCLSHHDQLRLVAVHILYCMIISKYHVSGIFNHIEHELVSNLDTLFMSDSKGDDITCAFFIGNLHRLFEESDIDEQLRALVDTFLQEVNMFLDLLLSVCALSESEEFADDRVIATLHLINFIQQIGRDEIYIKYVHQLVNMHLQAQNYVEAALTLKLHADLHDWDLNSFTPAMEDLGKGKAWESTIEICKELAVQHAEVMFNYARLAEILHHKAALLERIVTDQRYYSDYFRVAFYGSFPAAIHNKQFILLKPMGDLPVDIHFGTDQYIQYTTVTPGPGQDLPIFTNPDVSSQIRAYHEHSAIKLFSYSRPATRISPDVIGMQILQISPVQSAIQEVEEKMCEVAGLNLRYSILAKTSQAVPTNSLAMNLNTIIDVPAGSGIGAS
ncbi:uncharacterized protein LAESUDRAFT_713185 [Laetiporus sulphureus 93-53]|uniref:DOCKER domain-containing protein n=1 Tax=Laetiporus sulphureus 93-53 TaxID=1314785 RepID=A0A165EVD7_9APHY|nr:uncharacterized protein LAESUDRAFT_713185 [Laetiporus sulphureus 93-53]KZT07842.1 hypothetical protein LAESUDRAFT_713185 [Laetiporus sulphureus 93-53]